MPRIFISYRREDSRADAGRIYDRLSSHFGASNVFVDIDSLEPGVDFVDALQRTVESCDVFLAVLGNQWLTAKDEQGRTRLSNPEDFVALEIGAALERPRIRVVPILVGGAHMPRSTELPDRLRDLSRRHALDLPDKGFHQVLGSLIESIEKAEQDRLAQEKAEAAQRAEQERLAKAEQDRLAQEKAEAGRQAEQEQIAKAEQEQLERWLANAEQERLAGEKAEAAQRAEQERVAKVKEERLERLANAEQERLAREKADAKRERLAKEWVKRLAEAEEEKAEQQARLEEERKQAEKAEAKRGSGRRPT